MALDFSKFNFSGISAKGATKGASIYKAEIFDGLIDEQRKDMRKKLRRYRSKFTGAWLNAPNKEAKEKIFSQWEEYAKAVYLDLSQICDINTNPTDAKICADFCADFGAWLSKKSSPKK